MKGSLPPQVAATSYGANECPVGYIPITSAAECEATLTFASATLANSKFVASCQTGTSDTWCPDRPSGCIQDRNGELMYNERAQSNPTYQYVRVVCRAALAPHRDIDAAYGGSVPHGCYLDNEALPYLPLALARTGRPVSHLQAALSRIYRPPCLASTGRTEPQHVYTTPHLSKSL